ncbi:MAG: hypothetical protein ACRCWF_08880 [Beijerinckiaceae bacterium]
MTVSQLLLAAGILMITIAVIHSALGEILIFSRMGQGSIIPVAGGDLLRERHVRILWATWHIVSIFGMAFAVILIRLALWPSLPLQPAVLQMIASATTASGLLVLYASRGRHPGWIGLLIVGMLIFLALNGI